MKAHIIDNFTGAIMKWNQFRVATLDLVRAIEEAWRGKMHQIKISTAEVKLKVLYQNNMTFDKSSHFHFDRAKMNHVSLFAPFPFLRLEPTNASLA